MSEQERELREISINRSEFVQMQNIVYNMLKKSPPSSGSVKVSGGLDSNKTKAEHTKLRTKSDLSLDFIPGADLDLITTIDPDRFDTMAKYSYRDRMILLNRIDIYRLFITVIILSSQIKYPRVLTNVEEKELKEFINELNDFENIVLDSKMADDLIWDRGKVCEKHAVQLFTRFFNI